MGFFASSFIEVPLVKERPKTRQTKTEQNNRGEKKKHFL
jgi:hypothetical protein